MTGPACGNNPNHRMSDGDRRVVEDFKAYLAARAALRDRIAAAMREHYLSTNRDEADADRNMPCRCGGWREPGSMGTDEEDWDAHLADAVLAVLPAPVDRRAVLREAADRIDNEELPPDYVDMFDNGAGWAAKLLRRVADETAATETQADAMAALRTIRRDMDTARSGGDEWASEWFGDVWSQFPLALRAAAGDEDAATELAAAARQHAALPATADLFTGPQWDTYDPEAEEIERDIQRDAHIPARADNPGSMTPLPDDAARQDGAQP